MLRNRILDQKTPLHVFRGVLVETLLLGFLDMMTEKLLKLLLETPPRIQPKYDVRIYHRVNTV